MRGHDRGRALFASFLYDKVWGRELCGSTACLPVEGWAEAVGEALWGGRGLQHEVITGLIEDLRTTYSSMTNTLSRSSLKLLKDQSYSQSQDQGTKMWKLKTPNFKIQQTF